MRHLAIAVLALTLSACGAVPVRMVVRKPTDAELRVSMDSKRVVDRNYKIDVEQSAYVGDPIVRVKDYHVETSTSDAAFRSTVPMTASWWMAGSVTLPVETEFPIVGMVDKEGVAYYVVRFPSPAHANSAMLVDSSGTYDGLAYNFPMGMSYSPDPTGIQFKPFPTKFVRPTKEAVSKSGGYTNFEIVYSGATKESLNFLYREYTPEDVARPAFTQNLTYARDSSTIRFRDIQLRVLEAGNERIRYVVERDGSPSGTSEGGSTPP